MTDMPSVTRKILAEDIMTDVVNMVSEETLIHQVAHRMLHDRVSGYPVINKEKKIVGIVTLSDLLNIIHDCSQREASHFQDYLNQNKNLPVVHFMSPDVVAISAKTPLAEIVQIMLKKNIHTFPVMEGDQVVGIIGRHDVLNAVFVYS